MINKSNYLQNFILFFIVNFLLQSTHSFKLNWNKDGPYLNRLDNENIIKSNNKNQLSYKLFNGLDTNNQKYDQDDDDDDLQILSDLKNGLKISRKENYLNQISQFDEEFLTFLMKLSDKLRLNINNDEKLEKEDDDASSSSNDEGLKFFKRSRSAKREKPLTAEEKKKIEDAVTNNFINKLKNYYAITVRSRFG